jgi:hypothetical protein
MAISSKYIVQTRNRCVVKVFGDTSGGTGATASFGITASAFDNGSSGAYVDPRITNSSASLSKIVYGFTDNGQATLITLGFGSTASSAGMTSVEFVFPSGTNQLNFERFTIPNGVTNSPSGTFYVNTPAFGYVTAYLEFVPF